MDTEKVKIQTSTFRAIVEAHPNEKKHCLVKKGEKRFMYICQAAKSWKKSAKVFATGKFFMVDLTTGVVEWTELTIRYKHISMWEELSNLQGGKNIEKAIDRLRNSAVSPQSKTFSYQMYKLLGYEQKG